MQGQHGSEEEGLGGAAVDADAAMVAATSAAPRLRLLAVLARATTATASKKGELALASLTRLSSSAAVAPLRSRGIADEANTAGDGEREWR